MRCVTSVNQWCQEKTRNDSKGRSLDCCRHIDYDTFLLDGVTHIEHLVDILKGIFVRDQSIQAHYSRIHKTDVARDFEVLHIISTIRISKYFLYKLGFYMNFREFYLSSKIAFSRLFLIFFINLFLKQFNIESFKKYKFIISLIAKVTIKPNPF